MSENKTIDSILDLKIDPSTYDRFSFLMICNNDSNSKLIKDVVNIFPKKCYVLRPEKEWMEKKPYDNQVLRTKKIIETQEKYPDGTFQQSPVSSLAGIYNDYNEKNRKYQESIGIDPQKINDVLEKKKLPRIKAMCYFDNRDRFNVRDYDHSLGLYKFYETGINCIIIHNGIDLVDDRIPFLTYDNSNVIVFENVMDFYKYNSLTKAELNVGWQDDLNKYFIVVSTTEDSKKVYLLKK